MGPGKAEAIPGPISYAPSLPSSFSSQPIVNPALAEILSHAREVILMIDGVTYQPADLESPVWIPPSPAPSTPGNAFRLTGQVWSLHFAGIHALLQDSVGLRYIHLLMQERGQPIAASKLVRVVNGEPVDIRTDQESTQDDGNGLSTDPEARVAVLTPSTIAKLRSAIIGLREEAEALQLAGDLEGSEEKADEIDRIEEYLRKNTLCGRSTSFANQSDRDRKSVSLAISRAIAAIRKVNPSLADHLKAIRKGHSCCYQPATPMQWHL